jgi:hypothetical protein
MDINKPAAELLADAKRDYDTAAAGGVHERFDKIARDQILGTGDVPSGNPE